MQDKQVLHRDVDAGAEPPRDGLLRAILRTRATIDEETTALTDSGGDHGEFRRRKDLCLLDLSRRAPAFLRPQDDSELMLALRDLKDSIIRNQKLLRCHVDAARAVSAIILKAIADEESDRTYSVSPARKGSHF